MPVNAAIVGLGRWGLRLVEAVSVPASDKIRFTRAVVRTPGNVPRLLSERGIAIDTDFDAALADPEIDAVVLATPHTQHAAQIVSAARAGKHVFVEKPITLDADTARTAIAACEAAGVVLAPGHNRRFLPAMKEMVRRVRGERSARSSTLKATFPGTSGLAYTPGMWRATRVESPAGGMTAMGIHILDAFIHLAGPVDWVRCESHRKVVRVESDDTTSLLLGFRSGATGYLGTIIATGRIVRVQVFGTGGWLHLLDHHLLDVCDIDGRVKRIEFPRVDIERSELEAFADAVTGAAEYPVPATEAVHGIEVMRAAILSADRGADRVAVL